MKLYPPPDINPVLAIQKWVLRKRTQLEGLMSGIFSELFSQNMRAGPDPYDQGRRWVSTFLVHLDWVAANVPKNEFVENSKQRARGRPRKKAIDIDEDMHGERKTRSMKAKIETEMSIEALLNKPAIATSPKKGQRSNQVSLFRFSEFSNFHWRCRGGMI
jgi:hypothetical protein